MDQQAFQLLLDKIDGSKKDLQKDIADLKEHTHDRLEKVESKVDHHDKVVWKTSGAMVVLTVIFNAILAWFQGKGAGK